MYANIAILWDHPRDEDGTPWVERNAVHVRRYGHWVGVGQGRGLLARRALSASCSQVTRAAHRLRLGRENGRRVVAA